MYYKTIRKWCQHYLSSNLPLPPPLKVAQFSFITFNMFCHNCLPVFRSLPRFDSPPRLLFFPILVVLLADFKIPGGNTSNTPTLSSTTSTFIRIHLSSTENWFHGFTLDLLIASNLDLKSQSPISHYLLIYFHIPGFLSPTKPLALTCEDLNSIDPTTISYSPQGLLTFVLVLPKLDFAFGSEMTRSPALSIPWLLYPFSPLFWFWFPRRGLWGIECQSFTQEVILGSVKTWGSETNKGRKPLQDLLGSGCCCSWLRLNSPVELWAAVSKSSQSCPPTRDKAHTGIYPPACIGHGLRAAPRGTSSLELLASLLLEGQACLYS